MSKPQKWIDCYPQGTKEGDEEQRFFIALERHPKYEWRSTASLAKDAKLSKERVDEIIQKYFKAGIVVNSSTNDDHWGYWERVGVSGKSKSVVKTDQDKRVEKALA